MKNMTTYTTEYINEHSKDFLAFRDAFRKVWHLIGEIMKTIKSRIWDESNRKMVYLRGLYDNKYLLVEDPFAPKMLFSGLQDRNGNDIYEDDILTPVESYDNSTCRIIFRYGAFQKLWVNGLITPFEYNQYTLEMEDWVLIGNIHQNPELFKLRR